MAKKEQVEKGRVYVETSKGVYPYSVLKEAEIKPVPSKQLEQKLKYMTVMGLVNPPYKPETLLALYESNSILFRCVGQIAVDVAGLGWKLVLKEDKKEDKTEYNRLRELLLKPNPDDALRTILKELLIDLGSVGYFAMEVVRDVKGDIAALYHIPAYTIRVHSSKKKYCQIRNNKKVWFKKFGLKGDISPKDGKRGTFNLKRRANELIFYKNFYPKSDYYGVPNAISATGDILGLIGIRDYNLAFFENYGVPSAIIVLEGAWDKGSDKDVTKFLNTELKGAKQGHRTLVVTQPDNCKFTYTPLESKVKEGAFKLYEQTRRDDILIAHSMPPERIGVRIVGKLGGNVAEEATRIYVQSVVEPQQLDLEDIINSKLLQSEIYEFKFTDIDTRDYTAEVDRAVKLIEHGVKTPNEVRNDMGLKPYPDGDKLYMMSSLIEVGEPEEKLSKADEEAERFMDKLKIEREIRGTG